MPGQSVGTNINFKARPVLRKAPLPNNTVDIILGAAGIATAVNASAGGFTGLKHDDIIIYTNPEYSEQVYNRVETVFNDGKTIQLAAVAAGLGTGIYNGNLPVTTPSSGTQSVQAFLGIPNIRTSETGLFAPLPDANIASVDLDVSNLFLSKQITGEAANAQGKIVFDTSVFSDPTDLSFTTFDEERYSAHLTNGLIQQITSDNFAFSNTNEVTISTPLGATSNITVNATVQKSKIDSKIKVYNRSEKLEVTKSKHSTSGSIAIGDGTKNLADGLTFNQFFGLRVQDERISLNRPDAAKLIAVFESVDGLTPTLDKLKFDASVAISNNCVVGENIIGSDSNAIARVISTNAGGDPNSIEIVYLNCLLYTSDAADE